MGKYVRCIATTRDGSRCGRMGPADTQVCSIHSKGSSSPIIPDGAIDEIAILRKLARDTNPQIRLRAVDLLISLRKKEEKGCSICASRADADDMNTDVVRRLTPPQKSELRRLLAQVRTIKLEALKQPLSADTLEYEASLEKHYADIDQHPEPPGTTAQVSEPPAVRTGLDQTTADPDEVEIIFEDADAPEEDE